MKYLQKVQLRKHFDAIHLLKKDHICSICGKCYSRDSTLQVHMLTHDGEKNVICSVCGFRTHTKSKMTRHMKVSNFLNLNLHSLKFYLFFFSLTLVSVIMLVKSVASVSFIATMLSLMSTTYTRDFAIKLMRRN